MHLVTTAVAETMTRAFVLVIRHHKSRCDCVSCLAGKLPVLLTMGLPSVQWISVGSISCSPLGQWIRPAWVSGHWAARYLLRYVTKSARRNAGVTSFYRFSGLVDEEGRKTVGLYLVRIALEGCHFTFSLDKTIWRWRSWSSREGLHCCSETI